MSDRSSSSGVRQVVILVLAFLALAALFYYVPRLISSGKAQPTPTAAATPRASVTAPAGSSKAAATPGPATGTAVAKTPTATPRRTATPADGLKTVALSQLPAQARETIALIDKGGPFPYSQDGVVFQNREGLLPKKSSGYYHEYTVVTPGSSDRGARRIVAGSGGELYYTDDHYASFRRVVR